MHDESRVEPVLQALPLISIDRYVTRFIYEIYRGTALEAIGALRTGGRYNPPGIPALYTSPRRATALAESTQFFDDEDPIRPMLMLSVRVNSAKVADLTDSATLRTLGTSRAELTTLILDKRPGTATPQILGRIAYETGRIDGLLVWSRMIKREKNLVIFPDRLGIGYDLHDPAGDLPSIHPAIMEAMRALMQID